MRGFRAAAGDAIGGRTVNFGQIEAVYHIIKAGTFGAAARELHVTQSALSHRIKALEHELGGPLFVRGRLRTTLTPLGEEIAARTERIFLEFAEIRRLYVRRGAERKAESLRVTATSIGTAYLYGEFFEKFIGLFPDVDLQIIAAESGDDAVRRVLDRAADIALTSIPMRYTGVDTMVLGSAEIVLIAGTRHPILDLRRITLRDVMRWPFVRHLPGTGARVASDEIFLASGGYPKILTESSDTEYVKRIVSLGLGLSLVPLFTVQNELLAGTLHARMIEQHTVVQDFGMVLRRGFRPLLVERFVEVCTGMSRNKRKTYSLRNIARQAAEAKRAAERPAERPPSRPAPKTARPR